MQRAGGHLSSPRRAAFAALALVLLTSGTSVRAIVAAPASGGPDGGPHLEAPPSSNIIGDTLKPGGWVGVPSDVAGTMVLDHGELIVTDYVFDDRGADVLPIAVADYANRLASGDVATPLDGKGAVRSAYGDYAYPEGVPTGTADIVETRIAADDAAWYLLVKLNALDDPVRLALYVKIGDETIEALGGYAKAEGTPVDFHGDAARNFVELRVSRRVFDPGTATLPTVIGAGLGDPSLGQWYQPTPITRAKPMYDLAYVPLEGLSPSYWMERKQSEDLNTMDFSQDAIDVNFSRLTTDPCTSLCAGIEPYGFQIRDFRSSQPLEEGAEPDERVADPPAAGYRLYRSPVQPYAVYTPTDFTVPHALVLLLHPAGGNHMSFALTAWPGIKNWADEIDAAVAMPLGRGEAARFDGPSEKDVFEVWRDVAAHYPIDRERVYLMGVGAGGRGALRLAHLYPDQFARVVTWGAPMASPVETIACAGGRRIEHTEICTSDLMNMFGNASNIPLLIVNGALDAEVPLPLAELWVQELEASDTPYRHVVGATDESSTSDVGHGADVLAWLSGRPVRATVPTHVRYRLLRGSATANAYWLRDLRLADGVSLGDVEASTGVSARVGTSYGSDLDGNPLSPTISGRSFEEPARRPNWLELDTNGVAAVSVALGQLAWNVDEPGVVQGTAASPVDVLLQETFMDDTTVEGIPFEWTATGILLHVPAGTYHVELSPA